MNVSFAVGARAFTCSPRLVTAASEGQFWRAPHDKERMNINDDDFRYIPNVLSGTKIGVVREVVVQKHKSLPEVFRFPQFHSVLLIEPLQWLWRNVNPELSDEKWATLVTDELMLTNGTGFGGKNPRADYVNRRNLDAKPAAFDQVRFMGGAKFKGVEQGSNVLIETIRVDKPLPTAQELMGKDWLWYWGTGIRPDGGINYIWRRGIDGKDYRVRIPLFTAQQVSLPKDQLHKLPVGKPAPEPNWQFYS